MKYLTLVLLIPSLLLGCACRKTDDGEWHVHQARCIFMRTVYDEDGLEWVGLFLSSGEMIGPLRDPATIDWVVPDGGRRP